MAMELRPAKPATPPRSFVYEGHKHDTPATFSPIDEADLDLFLELLREHGIPSVAARQLGRGVIGFEMVRAQNPAFNEAWEFALQEFNGRLEAEAVRRAMKGVEKDIWYKGDIVGSETVYSDSLMNTLLKALPKYKGIDEEAPNKAAQPPQQVEIHVIPRGHFLKADEVDPDGVEERMRAGFATESELPEGTEASTGAEPEWSEGHDGELPDETAVGPRD